MTTLPPWMTDLEEEDWAFAKRFLLASGSLKEVAAQYGVSYPTFAVGPPDSKNPHERNDGGGSLCLAGKTAGFGWQTGI